jgi:hypothetical protein
MKESLECFLFVLNFVLMIVSLAALIAFMINGNVVATAYVACLTIILAVNSFYFSIARR